VLLRSFDTNATFHVNNSYLWVLADVGVTTGLFLDDGGTWQHDRDCLDSGICECDPGLPGIPVSKFFGTRNYFYDVFSREIEAALAAHRRWTGGLAEVTVLSPWSEDGRQLPAPAPRALGQVDKQAFLQVVELIAQSSTRGFTTDP
jgi:hypothetical protein